jgi:tetratricopeptide (TPR) repeat protein/predicted aspartyl protease
MPRNAVRRLTRIPMLVACACALWLGPNVDPMRAQQAAGGAGDVQVQLGDLLLAEGRYPEAADAYRRAAADPDADVASRAGAGLVLTQLRQADFRGAVAQAADLRATYPDNAAVASVHGDALWASGLFEEAEAAYDRAVTLQATHARGRHGRARALSARGRLDEALIEVQDALRLSPSDAEFHHTAGAIYERMHRFEEASAALVNYVNLLPNRERSEKAAWARAEIRFLEAFKGRTPFDLDGDRDRVWTVPIRISNDKVLVRGRVNGGSEADFILDTGAEQTVISRDIARRRGVVPITYVQSAGVGDVGLRGLQVGRLDTLQVGDLKIRNVPCLIKNPPLGGLPGREPESFSPLALGLSMRIDYTRRLLVMARNLPAEAYAAELPLRLHRLAMVRGRVNGMHPATFVVDTGGEVISISQSTAGLIEPDAAFRRIPLKVYGTSGWDKDAFLMPNVDLEFSSIRFNRIPVVVLNLRAPSALLGFELGGIVGHRFLSKYRVTIDLNRSIVGLADGSVVARGDAADAGR